MITNPVQKRGQSRLISPVQPTPHFAAATPFSALIPHATTVRLRRRQVLTFTNGRSDSVYVVQAGLLALQTVLPEKPRQLLALYFPGDVIGMTLPPPLPHAGVCGIVPAELQRLPIATFNTILEGDPALALQVAQRCAKQEARALVHAAIIGGLSGDERAASFLIELGLHSGTPSAQGRTFDVHMSRNDIADYLALNADTLSRIMSRLKARGLVAQTGRSRLVVPNWNALCAESPVASTLAALSETDET